MLKTDETRDRLLAAALDHVPFDGWGDKALMTAAEEIGIGADAARRAFPRGASSLIEYHSAWADQRMLDNLDEAALKDLGVRQRVSKAVRSRLEQNDSSREAIRAAVGYLAMPQNGLLSLKCLYRTVDAVWFAIGDKSLDFNFYSKRAILAGAYSATLLYWLDDQSEDHADSWAFLDRRLNDVVRIGRASGNLGNNLQRIVPSVGLLARLSKGELGRNFDFLRTRPPRPSGS